MQVVAQAHAAALGPQRGAALEYGGLEGDRFAPAIPPARELLDDRGAAVMAAPAAGQRGIELRVAPVGRPESSDVRPVEREAKGIHRGAHQPASSVAMASADGGRATPRSQTKADTSWAGVTSNAGLRTATSGSVTSSPPGRRTSSPSRSSISIWSPLGRRGSTDEVGPATTNGIPVARAASACA